MNKHIRQYRRIVTKINWLEKEFEDLRDQDLSAKTTLLKMRLKSSHSLERILPEAFALVREAAKRTIGMRAFNVQLQGAIAAHEGKIVEMKTGEGKTLTIAFAAFLNALEGNGVHVVTANDYLAKRDATWMGPVYRILGLSVEFVTSETSEFDRQVSYGADVTYATNNEIGFDFLKDNMLYEAENKRQRELNFAIVDEADSVLIDEAQTPLVISDSKSSSKDDKALYIKLSPLVMKLKKGTDFEVNIEERTVNLTPEGIGKLEKILNVENLYGDGDVDYLYFIERLLKAYALFEKDRDYIIENDAVVIVDEFTGRMMFNHRYYQGIHQAIEAKEGLSVLDENPTLAQITFQHLFRKYKKMAGLTGTAVSAGKEFRMIYKKEVVEIPTNERVIRQDQKDRFFLTWEDKLKYLAWSVKEHYFKKRAVLIGTRSVKKSHHVHVELLSENIPSSVLNAKHTSREAEVIASAGQPQTVTVATNMAGRGTDIKLHKDIQKDMGLLVFGTERHNARRIDNQLIGRSGRQGDPGVSQLLISADDELIKTHFKEEYEKELKRHKGWAEGIEHPVLEKLLARAQKRMEDVFFDQRVLNYEFDKVLEAQRKSFYRQRNRVLLDKDLKEETMRLISKEAYRRIVAPIKSRSGVITERDVQKIVFQMKKMVLNDWFRPHNELHAGIELRNLRMVAHKSISTYYNDFEKYVTSKKMRMIEKTVTLKVLDLLWVEHLKKVEAIQGAALVSLISKADFFEEFEMQMSVAYRAMLFSAPRVIVLTLFRTMDRLFKSFSQYNKIATKQ